MDKYDFNFIEKKWQKYWEENKTFQVTEDPSIPKEKRLYLLDMFPYPSGNGLHVGHPLGYTATDVWGRFKSMQGFHVLHPMGFDSFGLPAENYAIETGIHPKKTTETNINNFRKQIKSLGFAHDWSREVQTHDPKYYKWTQWIFLQLFKKGLAYEAEIPVWYCPALGTVLANEEVLELPEGPRSERGGHPVQRKALRQWMLRITAYADRLLTDLEELDWPESVKAMQRHWIGRSEGANIIFSLKNSQENIEVYTTRPDTLYGVTYVVLAPEHNLVPSLTTNEQKEKVENYLKATALKSELARTELSKEKTGVFTGSYAVHPLTGESVPIWIADYVLGNYGTGAVMAVPAHDQRDFEFAQELGLPFKIVVNPISNEPFTLEKAFTEEGVSINSEDLSGLNTKEMKEAVISRLEKLKKGSRKVNYRLRDWIFSRQRYWGEPIPIIHFKNGEMKAISENDLPLTLPEVVDYSPNSTGESPLARIKNWVEIKDPNTGEEIIRETNTMPQWAGSCWYYLRYLDPNNDQALASKEAINYWMPVDLYVGGAEHAVLHLLYARFWHKVLFDLGIVETKEPFQKLVNQGMITAYAFSRPDGSLVPNDKVEEENGKWFEKGTKVELKQIIAKMSKSLKNVVTPDDLINEYGADSFRTYEMFMGPLTDSKPWNTQGLVGVHRFLNKLWNLQSKIDEKEPTPKSLKSLHKAIAKVTQSTQRMEFNTAVSALMILVNEWQEEEYLNKNSWKDLILLLAPYAPHMSEELWEKAGEKNSLYKTNFPIAKEEFLKDDIVTVVFQINGKIRHKLELPSGLSKEDLEEMARKDAKIISLLEGKEIKKVIAVPNKLLNFVVS